MYNVNLMVILHYLGLFEAERYQRLNGYGIVMSPERKNDMAKATSLSEEKISSMLLCRYDGICLDLSDIDSTADSVRRASVREWAYFSGSLACPQCLAESAGAWKLNWKLPWSFACPKHGVYLIDSCPECGRRLRSGRTDGSLSPLFVETVPKPGLCGNPKQKGVSSAGRGALPCDCWVSSLHAEPAPLRTLRLQQHLDRALLGVRQVVAGHEVSSKDYFRDLKGLCALLLAYANLTDLGPLSKFESDAFGSFALARDEKGIERSESLSPRNAGRTRVLIGAPKNPALMAAVSSLAVKILRAPSVTDAAQLLQPVSTRMAVKSRRSAIKHFGFGSIVGDIVQESITDNSHFDHTVGSKSVAARHAKYCFEARHVPQLMFDDDYKERLARFFPSVRPNLARRFCSMSLVKLSGDYTWEQSAIALDLPPASAIKMANKAVGLLAAGDNKKAFARELHKVALRLSEQQELVDYATRRKKFAKLTEIRRGIWVELCQRSGVGVGERGSRNRYAAAWLWAYLTGGDWTLAPGLQEGNITNLREVFRQLEKKVFPLMAQVLHEYGDSLVRDMRSNGTDLIHQADLRAPSVDPARACTAGKQRV
jgi:hypothetical protein